MIIRYIYIYTVYIHVNPVYVFADYFQKYKETYWVPCWCPTKSNITCHMVDFTDSVCICQVPKNDMSSCLDGLLDGHVSASPSWWFWNPGNDPMADQHSLI